MIGFYNYTVILTYLSSFSSLCGIIFACSGKSGLAVLCLLFSGLCDMFDGAVARTMDRTDSEKKFGIWIDSLSDMVCFAVLPPIIAYSMGMKDYYFLPILGFYVLAAIIRLGYYGVTEEERQSKETGKRKYYEGLPVTLSAIIIPLTWLITYLFRFSDSVTKWIFSAVVFLTALAFITPFKIPKPGTKGILIIGACGLVVVLALIILL